MEWLERLNCAIQYIEEHLEDKIEDAALAKIAGCSTYHFQRMFGYMVDVSLSEYIRRRRMSKAAVDLQTEKILDVALKYGYTSPTAFNRAFQSIHGIAPSQMKKQGAVRKTYPPISFQISIKGVAAMEYRLEKKEAFRIIGIGMELKKELEENFQVVPLKWQQAAMDGTLEALAKKMEGQGVLGVSACEVPEQWRYYIAVKSNQFLEEGWEEYTVPAAQWAIFSGEGKSQTIQELEKRVFIEWLPTSGYEYGHGPDIEVYLTPDSDHAKYEIWIPVVKNNKKTGGLIK